MFLGVTDTSDLGVEEISFPSSAKQQSVKFQHSQGSGKRPLDLPLDIPPEEKASQAEQLESDAQLAEQLQLKENTYRTPRFVQSQLDG